MQWNVKSITLLSLLILLPQKQQIQQPQSMVEAYAVYSSSLMYTPASQTNRGSKFQEQKLLNRRQTFLIYDTKTGRQLEPQVYVPPVLAGNKRRPTRPQGNLVELPQLWNPCVCAEYTCTCCVGLRFGDTFNQRFCVILKYDSIQLSVHMQININKRNVISFDFSARNPPAYCVPVLLPLPIYACLRLYDLSVQGGNVRICLALILNAFMNQIFEFHFDCVHFGSNGVHFVKTTNFDAESPSIGDSNDSDDELRQNIALDENYSGISVEKRYSKILYTNE